MNTMDLDRLGDEIAELTEIYQIESDFEAKVTSAFDEMIARVGAAPAPAISS